MENITLKLLQPPPDEKLAAWLSEMYGKPVVIASRELLRHRDLSYVERLCLLDAVPESLIYKVVLPPWDIEQDLHEHILIPSVSSSPRLYLSGHYHGMTALFLEDLGRQSLVELATSESANQLGTELAKLHRSFTYRIQELRDSSILRHVLPTDYESLCGMLCSSLKSWHLMDKDQESQLTRLAQIIASRFETEPISLVHGDFYAENIIIDKNKLFIIDWSWFTIIGAAIMDLASLTMDHIKNGSLQEFRQEVIGAYCMEYSRDQDELLVQLPYAEALSRLFFLHWLVERRSRGILGTTVGPVDPLIQKVIAELQERLVSLDNRS